MSQHLGFMDELLRPLHISDSCLFSMPSLFDHLIASFGAGIPGALRLHK
jgi:hypothetical protein